jgi:hypothetical protein
VEFLSAHPALMGHIERMTSGGDSASVAEA